MKTYIKITAIFLFFTLLGCSSKEDFYLDRNIFIEDPTSPDLPIYSEEGYNSFGAYINRFPFVSNLSSGIPQITIKKDTMFFSLKGIYKKSTQKYYRQDVTLDFRFIDNFSQKKLDKYTDLMFFNNYMVNFNNTNTKITLKINEEKHQLKIVDGKMHFKKARKLFLDDEIMKVVLSGRFYFKAFMNNDDSDIITIKSGRFDLGFGYDNYNHFE
ncbi:MAG: hypothetical protein CR965_00330 [Paludibacter sp.]|nr:MAG: hypothetical protein CR965_00330 [Paludibacter sp.]